MLKQQTVLVLGPPHSGKSIFAYILCEELRKLGDDAALFECDTFSPSLHKIMPIPQPDHLYSAGHTGKREISSSDDYLKSLRYASIYVIQKGIILLDGVGQHTESTKLLIRELTDRLLVVCSGKELDDERLLAYGFKDADGRPKDPIRFYEDLCKTTEKELCLKVTTWLSEDNRAAICNLDEVRRSAVLVDLRLTDQDGNKLLENGDYSKLPNATVSTISEIAKFLLKTLNRIDRHCNC